MRVEKIVVDTNVLISAALNSRGKPRAAVDAIRSQNGMPVFSEETFAELRHRFSSPKFNQYVGHDLRAVWLAQIQSVSLWVSITGAKLGCRDRNDDMLLESALMGEADCLVTGDTDLLIMSKFQLIPIIAPAEFLNRVNNG